MRSLAIRCSGLRTLFVIGLAFLVGATTAHAQAKKIAILAFDDRLAGTQQMAIGQKVADGLIAKIAGNGTFEVVDRDYLARIVAEQNLKVDARFDPADAVKLGKLANIDVLVVGQIDAFHADASTDTANGFFSNKTKVTGQISLKVTTRLISVETASILAAPTASSELQQVLSEKTDYMPSNQGSISSKTTGVGNVQTALLKLVDNSVDEVSEKLAKQIEGNVTKIPNGAAHGAAITAKVIGMEGASVLVNRGATAGIKVGDQFSIFRPVDTGMKDPDTGQPVIRRKKVCTLEVTETDDSTSAGKCSGDQPVAGDEVRPSQN